MSITVNQTDDAADALSLAAQFLATRPVDHNLVLTILHDRVARPEPGHYWLVHDGASIVGLGLQSPISFFATLTPMSRAQTIALASAMAAAVPDLPGISGDAASAATFAGCWAEIHATAATPDLGQRLYALATLHEPNGIPGHARPATAADDELVAEWFRGFSADTGEPPLTDPVVNARTRIADGRIWLWDDGGPRSMAGFTRAVGAVARVGPVYTPPEHRRHGYGAACTAAVSRHVLDHHAGGCVLYTDLANPTSNAIYQRLGYQAVGEVLRYRFGD
jgi:GNAT superfamily N-acetyltransferase